MDSRAVLLYGSSLLLSLVAADLAQCPALAVVQAADWKVASSYLETSAPDVLIFDLTSEHESHILPLLLKHPGLLMLGLDAESNQAVLVSGQGAQSLTLDRLRSLVEGVG